jgi:hypothetical protein
MQILKNIWVWVFVIIALVVTANKGYKTFFLRPCSMHQWRQSDGASYALNYYQYDIDFLPSQVHHRHAIDGKAMSEFPVIYYLAAQMYKVFGFHDYFIRLIHFSIFILGLVFITKTAGLFTRNVFLRLIPMAFTVTSAYLFYYAANYLPDVAALSFAMAGLYYFLLFDKNKKFTLLLISFLLFMLAGLLKISGAILMVCSVCYLIHQIIFNKPYYAGFKLTSKIFIFIIPFIALLTLYGWVQYDKYVAEHYHFGGNLFGFLPIWEASVKDILYILKRITLLWLPVILEKYAWIMLICCIILFIAKYKLQNSVIRFFTILASIGVFLYCMLWYKTFDVHDYYMINLFCLPLLLFYSMIDVVEKKQWLKGRNFSYAYYGAFLLLFIYSGYKCRAEQLYRYYEDEYNTFNNSYYRIEPYLRSIGISKDDIVVSVPDPSPNITLYFMNSIGFSECYTSENYNVNYFVHNAGAKYLIVGDSSYVHNPTYEQYCKPEYKIGAFEGIQIFKTHRLY